MHRGFPYLGESFQTREKGSLELVTPVLPIGHRVVAERALQSDGVDDGDIFELAEGHVLRDRESV